MMMRNLVTSSLLLSLLAVAACREKVTPVSLDQAKLAKAVQDGNEKLAQSELIRYDLNQNYSIALTAGPVKGSIIRPENVNWYQVSRQSRQEIKEKLASYVTVASQLIELDAKMRIVIYRVDQILGWRNSAMAFLESLRAFEKVHGEQFEPPKFKPKQDHRKGNSLEV
jgi:hypothetical protein